jgi:hypothetical protein
MSGLVQANDFSGETSRLSDAADEDGRSQAKSYSLEWNQHLDPVQFSMVTSAGGHHRTLKNLRISTAIKLAFGC